MAKKILVVDDEKQIVGSIRNALELRFMVEVESATDGEEALERIRESANPFSLVITDYNMPKMNGLELVDIVQKEYPKIPFILMTASVDSTFKSWMKENNIIEFIDKPFDIKTLYETIEKKL